MKKIVAIILFLTFFLLPKEVIAIYNPQDLPNNRFGIHIVDENDLMDASNLVNSNGGQWGYVTFVIQEGDRDLNRWFNVFTSLRKLKLIPIVRIATSIERNNWQKPDINKIGDWVSFLDSLPWPIENRYVIIGNEPNHAKEWGGKVEPHEYATYFVEFSKSLKESSADFFVLPAGLDASAPNSYLTMDEVLYLKRMLEVEPNFLSYIDAWNSHSYPNPNFTGSELDSGRGSVRTFEWELELLKEYGLTRQLPVFITETGWAHNQEGKVKEFVNTDSLGEKLKYAFENVWNSKEIVTVTPFIFNYQDSPFEMFSWKKTDGSFYPFYNDVMSLAKVKGEPKTNNFRDFDAMNFLKERGLLDQEESMRDFTPSAILAKVKSRLKFAKIDKSKEILD